ncbi:MAG: hypothetical protein HN919_17645, partial [Verrucomicrobia bacterium]|nr:hypothetical protein [Verrucomicrobiota bacterium]
MKRLSSIAALMGLVLAIQGTAKAEVVLSSDFAGVVKNNTTKIADSFSWTAVSGMNAPATSLQFIDGDSTTVLQFFNVTANEIDVNNNMTAGGWDTSIELILDAGTTEIDLTDIVLNMRLTNGSGGSQSTSSKTGRMVVELVGSSSGSLGVIDPGNSGYPSDVYTRTVDLSSLPTLDKTETYTLYIKARGTGYGHHKSFQGMTLNGTVTGAPVDNTPPNPATMTFAVPPYATGQNSIAMTATTATDDSGVEYYFAETSGNPGGDDSAWQLGTEYTDTGLDADTEYSYTVQARDRSLNNNSNAVSALSSATTDAPDTTPPTPGTMTFHILPAADDDTSISMIATTATDSSGVEYYFAETSGNSGGSDSVWQSDTNYTDVALIPGTEYSYTVQARDLSPAQNS